MVPPAEVTLVHHFSFDNEPFVNCTKLTIVNKDTSSWLTGYTLHATVYLHQIVSTKMRSEDFVIALLKYWNKTKTSPNSNSRKQKIDENATQKYRRRGYRVMPARIWLTVDDSPIFNNQTHRPIQKIYSNSLKKIAANLLLNPKGLPLRILIKLPEKLAGSTAECKNFAEFPCDTPYSPVYVRPSGSLKISPQKSITNKEAPVQASSSESTIKLNFDYTKTKVWFDLTSDHLENNCQPNCNISLILSAQLIPEFVSIGDTLSISSMVLYGEAFKLNYTSVPALIEIIGPDLSLSLLPLFTAKSLEAGFVAEYRLLLNHSLRSTQPLLIRQVQLVVLSEDWNELEEEYCGVLSSNNVSESSPCNDSMTKGFLIGNYVDLNQTVEIQFGLKLTDSISIASSLPVTVTASFSNFHEDDRCLPEPCFHGGQCTSIKGSPNTCQCNTAFSGQNCAKRTCPQGWISSKGGSSCFFFPEKKLKFSEAKRVCYDMNSNLPIITRKVDGGALDQVLHDDQVRKFTNETWIGLTKDEVENKWHWPKWTSVSAYRRWAVAEPSVNNFSCAIAKPALENFPQWKSTDCADQHYFLCSDISSTSDSNLLHRSATHRLHVRDIDISKVDIGLRDRLRVHEPLTIKLDLQLPRGKISDMSLETVFQSEHLNLIPIQFIESEITADDCLNFSRPDLLFTGSSARAQVSELTAAPGTSRKKRSISQSVSGNDTAILSISRTIGDIINSAESGQSGAKMSISQDSSNPGGVLIMSTVSHYGNSTSPAYDLEYCDDISCISLVRDSPGIKDKNGVMRVRRQALEIGDTMQFQYSAASNSELKRDVPTDNNASVHYKDCCEPGQLVLKDYPGTTKSTQVSTCFHWAPDVKIVKAFHHHGFSALAYLLALVITFIICLLAMILWFKWKRSQTRPALTENEEGRREVGGLLAGSSSREPDEHAEIGTMTVEPDDTVLPSLIQDGKQQIMRNLDKQAVAGTIQTEGNLREEKLKDMLDAAVLVVNDMATRGVVEEEHSNNLGQKMVKKVGSTFRKGSFIKYVTPAVKVDEEYEQAAVQLKEELGAKNTHIVKEVRKKQKAKNAEISRQNGQDAETSGAINSVHAAEMDNLLYRLQLQQELEMQKLKTKFVAKKESALTALQSQLSEELEKEGRIDGHVAERIGAELSAVGAEVSGWYDQERARQRALLEHKYNLRKTLALQKDLNDRQRHDLLNRILTQQFQAVDCFLKNRGIITKETADDMKKELKIQAANLKKWFESERKIREKKLHKAITAENKQKISDLKKRQAKELLEESSKAKNLGSKSALKKLKDRQQLLSEQKKELLHFEENLDQDVAGKLNSLHQELTEEGRNHLEIQKKQMFKDKGISTEEAEELFQKQKEELNAMVEHQKRVKNEQEEILDEDLKQKQSELMNQIDLELEAQTALRDHEQNIFKNLLQQQVMLSEADRKELLRYKDEQLAQVENSLITGKLSQLDLLETKLEQRRASAIEQIEQDNLDKLRKKGKSGLDSAADAKSTNSSDSNLSAAGGDDLKLIRDVAKQKLEVLKQTTLDHAKEIKQVQGLLMDQRAQKLREQEDKLGSLIAQLQMKKSKQLSQLEEKEEALEGLTSCMVEDLTERGILSNPDCHRIMERHEMERKRLSEQLSAQKSKQDQLLKQELEERDHP